MGLSIFAIALSGWSSNSKYAFLGSIRAVAQMVSYEIALGLILIGVIIPSKSLNLITINQIQIITGNYIFLL